MNINGNAGFMPYNPNQGCSTGNCGSKPFPMPPIIGHCPTGGTIPNFHGPVGADTINYFGSTGPALVNYFGSYQAKSYTMQSYNCPPPVYNMVDVSWQQPSYPQPIYHPQPMPNYNWGAKY